MKWNVWLILSFKKLDFLANHYLKLQDCMATMYNALNEVTSEAKFLLCYRCLPSQ